MFQKLISIFSIAIFLLAPLGTQLSSGLTVSEEEKISRSIVRYIYKHYEIIDDPLIVDYVNQVGNRNNWIGLRLVTADGKRDALGARVAVDTADDRVLWRRVRAEGSYASSNDPRVLIGLGGTESVRRVRVIWPDGVSEEWFDLPVVEYSTLRQGTGKPTA